jgi:hypothetical protein
MRRDEGAVCGPIHMDSTSTRANGRRRVLGSNARATHGDCTGTAAIRVLGLTLLAITLASATARAQPETTPPPPTAARGTWSDSVLPFLGGGAIGLATHEAGHVFFDLLFDAKPGLAKVDFHGIPFFAITHRNVSPAKEYTIASAGFWVQNAEAEWLLTKRPQLRREHAPLAKGVLAFDVVASAAYAGAAFAKTGPVERDTRGMASSLRVDERWIGVLVLAPALLDTLRYFNPDAKWATWTSRGVKAGMVLLVIRAGSR